MKLQIEGSDATEYKITLGYRDVILTGRLYRAPLGKGWLLDGKGIAPMFDPHRIGNRFTTTMRAIEKAGTFMEDVALQKANSRKEIA